MSDVESSKTLAGVGSILLILSIVPYAGVVLGIVGIILFLMGIKGLASYYQNNEIYQDSVTGVIYYIIAVVAAAVAVIALAIGFATFGFLAGLGVFFIGLIIAFIFYILAASRLRKTFDLLAQKSGDHSFSTAGTLLWWGAILTIIFVGLILIFIAWIFATIGFFSMKLQPQQQYASQPSSYTPPPTQAPAAQPTPAPVAQPTQATQYCPNCGAPVKPNTAFCPNCGKPLPQ